MTHKPTVAGSFNFDITQGVGIIVAHAERPVDAPTWGLLVRLSGSSNTRALDHLKGESMGKVSAGATMSIDGFIAGPNETGFDLLFQWYGNGEVEIPSPIEPPIRVSEASAAVLRQEWGDTGALVVGRHLFDMMDGWGGRHPMDVTTVVVTHHLPDDRPAEDENFVFVTDGIEAAVARAKEIAGDRKVGVNGGQMARQCLEAGLLDEIGIDLVPVVLGGGTHFFEGLATPMQFEGPISVVEGRGVTHLRYRVVK